MNKAMHEGHRGCEHSADHARRSWLQISAWCSYDWANSAFPTVITTFIFSVYFTQTVAASPVEGTVLWSRAVTLAGLAVAVVSPILGAIADFSGPRKPWLFAFTAACAFLTACLWFVRPDTEFVYLALATYGLASISYQFAIIFYDAMLKDIAPRRILGRVSGWGWSAGYAGGLVCLALSLWIVHNGAGGVFSLDVATAEPVRATTLLVAFWFALFSVPIFLLVPDRPALGLSFDRAIHAGLRQLPATIAMLRHNPPIARFLVAHMFYTDGLVTLFAFGGIYAAAEFGMTASEILVFGIILNVAAGAGAAAFAWLDDMIGSKNTVVLALVGLVLSTTGLLLSRTVTHFWLLAILLGVFVGPAQAAGRSLMARLAPKGIETEMFGLYALAGKATAFAGPLVLGLVVQWSDSQRAGMTVVIAFLLCGLIIMWSVREPATIDN
jgi:UMF1 family MFS transporter